MVVITVEVLGHNQHQASLTQDPEVAVVGGVVPIIPSKAAAQVL